MSYFCKKTKLLQYITFCFVCKNIIVDVEKFRDFKSKNPLVFSLYFSRNNYAFIFDGQLLNINILNILQGMAVKMKMSVT